MHYIARELDEDQQQARSPRAHSAVEGKSPLSQAVDSSALGKDSLRMWWPETGSVSCAANRICNLQILKDAESARNAKLPKPSCKSLARFSYAFANVAMGKGGVVPEEVSHRRYG